MLKPVTYGIIFLVNFSGDSEGKEDRHTHKNKVLYYATLFPYVKEIVIRYHEVLPI
jgi:hypothetical protein